MELFKKIFRYYKPHRYGIIGTILLVITCQICLVCTSYFFGQGIDALQVGGDLKLFLSMATCYGIFLFLESPILAFLRERFRDLHVNYPLSNRARRESLEHYCTMSGHQQKGQNFLLSSTVIQEGIDAVVEFEANCFYVGIPLLAYTSVMLGLLATRNFWFFLIALLIIGVFCFETYRMNVHIMPDVMHIRDLRQKLRGKRYREYLKNIFLIKANGQERQVVEECRKNDELLSAKEFAMWEWYRKRSLFRSSFLSLGRITMFILGGILISNKAVTAGTFMMSWACIESICPQLWSVGHIIRQTMKNIAAMEAYFRFHELNPTIQSGTEKLNFEKPPEISFLNVDYTYVPVESLEANEDSGGATAEALKDISLKINAGEKIGIVGESGSGKTTLSQLLFRFGDPTNGKIMINGVDIRELDLEHYLQAIGFVPQHHEFFDESFRENIMFPLSGRETTVDDNILLELCDRARMMDVINRYPKQLDARVGEGAKFLSGGEQQRLAIIRTLAKNPMLLVLDEATASLDTHNEERIQQLIQEASHGRTTIIIAHRLSTLRFVDRIVVMHKGSIIDIGSHEQLLGRCGIYQNLVSKQTLALGTTHAAQ